MSNVDDYPALTPVPYSPDVEMLAPDEPETAQGLKETLLSMSKTMAEHTGHAARSVHAKNFGMLRASLEVLPDLPEPLAQGLFAQPATYDALVRFSTPPAEALDDRVSLPRAMALKVLGVPGDRLAGSEQDTTQDFLMVNGPVFSVPDAKGFLRNLKLLAATTDKVPTAKRVLSSVLRTAEAASRRSVAKAPSSRRWGVIRKPSRWVRRFFHKCRCDMGITSPRSAWHLALPDCWP